MIVTDIVPINGKRSRIFLDMEYAFPLYRGEIRKYGIRLGSELTKESYEEITTEILPKRAKLRAMNLLKSRPYTERRLRDKLEKGYYPAEIIDKALDYVKSYHYVDDAAYARDYIEYHKEYKSRRRMLQDLLTKGIDKRVIQEALEEGLSEDGEALEEQLVLKELRKKHYNRSSADYTERRKMQAFLYRKGFSEAAIRKGMEADPE